MARKKMYELDPRFYEFTFEELGFLPRNKAAGEEEDAEDDERATKPTNRPRQR